MENVEKICKNCEHWQPKYYGVGVCVQEGLPNSKFWVTKAGDGSQLLTVASFGCESFEDKKHYSEGTV